jgi:uncharacterized protein (DUF1810 family)
MSNQTQVDPYNLQRFVLAQDPVFTQVLGELKRGEKRQHWMWFVFPQIKGLGQSQIANKYAISSGAEAKAYLGHPILGIRLIQCTQLTLATEERVAEQIFGTIDACKFKSSMTLFASVAPDQRVFQDALERYYHGELDSKTLNLLQ